MPDDMNASEPVAQAGRTLRGAGGASPGRGAGAALAVCAFCSLLSSCWYLKQGTAFLGERARAVPLDRALRSADAPEGLAAFAALVEDIRRFSTDELGLKPTKNYTKYVVMDKGYVADVVSACAADSFERHYWRYPFLGELPYKGFYDIADARAEAARLKEAGLDVIVRQVDAFSSLGIMRDPLYSFMLDYAPDQLAELIVHESVHATLFVKGQDQFNEELATFVGRTGAERYVASRYGQDSPLLAERARRRADAERFTAFLKGSGALLEAVYTDPLLDRTAKLAEKTRILAERGRLYAETEAALFAAAGYREFDMAAINNAYIDLYRLYEEDLSPYQALLDGPAGGDLGRFMAIVNELARAAGKAGAARGEEGDLRVLVRSYAP